MNFTRDSALIVGTACILLAGLGIFTLFSTLSAPPHGDEPHYLLMTVSLIRDGDLNLADNYARRDARAFMKEPLMPHWGLRENGKLYSSHDPGLAVLLAPAFAAAGRPGASLCMAVLGLMALCVTMGLARRLGIPARSTALGVLMAGLTVPYLMMSGAAFPEIPAALGLMAAVMLLFRGNCGRHFLTGGLCLGLIPWFHLKYAAISVLVFLMFPLWQRPRFRSAVMTAIPAAISAAGLLLFQRYLYGDPFYLLRIKSGGFQWPFTGMAGLMLDREVGLLVFAPVLIPGLMGLLFRWRRPREMNALAVVFIIFWILSGSWTDWHSGHCPPSRYLVPFIPALGLFTAWELHRVRDRSGRGLFALLWGASLAQVAGVFLTIPENAIVHYDGINRLWTRFLPWNLEYLAPSLLNPRPGTGLQAAAWLLLVTAAGLV
ncbi:MAG TPA: hypothetical protein PLV45_00735, partial [bacterium]|nr:hypothetical protein [bacterium]